jgi:hypothetical protein
MEGLIQLVSDCLARHGLLPADDPQPGESAPTLVAAPLPEVLPEHNFRKVSDPPSPGTAARAGRGAAAL